MVTPAVETSSASMLYMEEYQPQFVYFLFVVFPIVPLFWKYHVSIDEKKLSFGYTSSLTCKTADRSDVIAAKPFEIHPMRHWGGWGIRMGMFSTWKQTGYIAQGGSGVQVTFKDSSGKESIYVFSCQNPDKVCSLLTQQ